ncbi:hypothetical protein VNO78_08048 [Psophocarpus tetragonolobus]|uniref:Uncharacterized protein n=1 Tax=Psophocarpus tetragonolobus TaxID=3891 RepID=A0AAN9SX87_PSOTE
MNGGGGSVDSGATGSEEIWWLYRSHDGAESGREEIWGWWLLGLSDEEDIWWLYRNHGGVGMGRRLRVFLGARVRSGFDLEKVAGRRSGLVVVGFVWQRGDLGARVRSGSDLEKVAGRRSGLVVVGFVWRRGDLGWWFNRNRGGAVSLSLRRYRKGAMETQKTREGTNQQRKSAEDQGEPYLELSSTTFYHA